MKLRHIPNILSVIRILLVGVFVYTFFCVDPYIALVVFLVAGATDVIDGYLARRNNWITRMGKILDPVADKLMQCTVLVCLLIENIVPWWFVVPFFAKELASLFMGLIVLGRRDIVIVSKWYGKMTVCVFYATIVISVLVQDALKGNIALTIAVFLPAIVCAVATFVAYVKHYMSLKDRAKAAEFRANAKKAEGKSDTAEAAESN